MTNLDESETPEPSKDKGPSFHLVIAGGGTGGHLFPGIAVGEELLRKVPDAKLSFVGTERGLESKVVPELGHDLHLLKVSGLKTVGAAGALIGALRIPGALWSSRRLLKRLRPDAVIGVGGYASGPLVLAAKSLGIRTAILEQNSIPGLTNRILGRFVDRVFLSFAHSQSFFDENRSALVGNPVRRNIAAGLGEEGQESEEKVDDASQPVRGIVALKVFVFGGSQGAVAVNERMTRATGIAQGLGLTLQLVHQVGSNRSQEVAALYEREEVICHIPEQEQDVRLATHSGKGAEVEVHDFIRDMAAHYRWADVVVCRSGATSIAELGVVGKPAIFIPYPYAANDHQVLNAEEMVQAKAAFMLQQSDDLETDAKALAAHLQELADPNKQRSMGEAMKGCGRADAAQAVSSWLLGGGSRAT